jgi:hypothetical protein
VSLTLKVECYAGHKADERPLRFSIVASSETDPTIPPPRVHEVNEVLDQWYGPDYQCFKVLADDGNLYILRHDHDEDVWTLDSFRRDSATDFGRVKS